MTIVSPNLSVGSQSFTTSPRFRDPVLLFSLTCMHLGIKSKCKIEILSYSHQATRQDETGIVFIYRCQATS